MKYQFALVVAVALVAVAYAMETCTPGEMYTVDCNTCICPKNGDKDAAACTLKLCPENQNTDNGNVPNNPTDADVNKCTPGSTFMKDCNTCTCPEDGSKTGASCTTLACPQPSTSS